MKVSDVSRVKADRVEVDILVSPRSNRSGFDGFDEWRKRLILRVKAPPLDGRANKEVESFFNEITQCKSKVTSGMTSHQKTVTVSGDPNGIIVSLEEAVQ